jgi:hypothetical protein
MESIQLEESSPLAKNTNLQALGKLTMTPQPAKLSREQH